MTINAQTKATCIVMAILLPFMTSANASVSVTDGQTVTVEVVKEEKNQQDVWRESKHLTDQQLVDVLKYVGFEGKALKTAWAIVKRESSGRPPAHNDNPSTGDNSYGLFQINMIGSLGADRREKFGIEKNSDLLDPIINAKAAYYMSARGTNFASWGLGPDAYDGSASEPSVTKWLEKFPNQ